MRIFGIGCYVDDLLFTGRVRFVALIVRMSLASCIRTDKINFSSSFAYRWFLSPVAASSQEISGGRPTGMSYLLLWAFA